MSASCAESCLGVTNDFTSHLMSHVPVVTGFYLWQLRLVFAALQLYSEDVFVWIVTNHRGWENVFGSPVQSFCLLLRLTWARSEIVTGSKMSGKRFELCSCSAAWRLLSFHHIQRWNIKNNNFPWDWRRTELLRRVSTVCCAHIHNKKRLIHNKKNYITKDPSCLVRQ